MTKSNKTSTSRGDTDFDAIVVGAGFGGLYGVYRLGKQGLSVLGLEGAGGVGGVWYHNCYPGARVDVESFDYCYYFSEELYREWQWSEKYAAQPELLRYLNHVADRFDVRRHYRFNTWLTEAQWHPQEARYHVKTSSGLDFRCQFLILATGQLSAARRPHFEGLDAFQGEWVTTAHWPDRDVQLEGRRIGVIGTGSSGVQVITEVAKVASQVYVFQRTPKYSVPARNGPIHDSLWSTVKLNVRGERERLFANAGGSHMPSSGMKAEEFTTEEQRRILEDFWDRGGQAMQLVFADQHTNIQSNEVIARFVRDKIRSIVKDPATAEKLCPDDHPFCSRRLILDIGYYEAFNRGNVTLVDVRAHPIERITTTGIRTVDGSHYDLDLIIFALGFDAFTGSLDKANIRNEKGLTPTERWHQGPRTLLGLTTVGFPNLFMPTGAGSPSLLANLVVQNEFQMDWIADCVSYMAEHGYATIEATEEAESEWTNHVAEVSKNLLRRQVNNYMVQVTADGSRIFLPYCGGLDRFVRRAKDIAAKGYEGYEFGLRGPESGLLKEHAD